MANARTKRIGVRTGLAGWFDRVRFNEALRQGLGLLLVAACAHFARPGSAAVAAGLAAALLGQAFRIYAAGYIFKNRQLASSGPYALVRHPLYLGNFLILAGFTLASGNAYVALAAAVFFLVWYPAAISYEDNKLERLFGDEWREWSARVSAIVPGPCRWSDLKAGGWDTYQSLIHNGELPISLYLFSCGIWLWVVSHGRFLSGVPR